MKVSLNPSPQPTLFHKILGILMFLRIAAFLVWCAVKGADPEFQRRSAEESEKLAVQREKERIEEERADAFRKMRIHLEAIQEIELEKQRRAR